MLQRVEYQSQYTREYFGRGKAEGKAEAILLVLRARSVAVSPSDEARILACAEVPQLDRWLALAVNVRAVDELV